MGWLKVDDNFMDHPKFLLALHEGGELVTHLWFRGLTYSRRFHTDGVLPKYIVAQFSSSRAQAKAINGLLKSALWRDAGDSFVIHDYLDWYESREAVEAKKKANTAKVKGWRERMKPPCNQVTERLVTGYEAVGNRVVTDVQPTCNPPRSAASDSDSDSDTDKSDSEPRDVAQGAVRPSGAGLPPAGSVDVASAEPAPLAAPPATSQPPTPPSAPLPPQEPATGQPGAGEESPPSQVRRADPRTAQVAEVLEHWVAKLYPTRRPALDEKRRGVVKARLADFSVEDLKLAIDGCAKSPFHVEGGHKDIGLICRDSAHVERFLAIARGEVKPDGGQARPSWQRPVQGGSEHAAGQATSTLRWNAEKEDWDEPAPAGAGGAP